MFAAYLQHFRRVVNELNVHLFSEISYKMNFVFKQILAFLLFIIIFISCKNASHFPYAIRKSAIGSNGMVVTGHPLATQVGLDIFKAGGNAADASIAVQFALAVVYPRAGNLGGGGFLVYRNQAGEITTLDYREKAPLAATRDMYLDSLGQVIEGLSREGILSAGVPGTVAGLIEMHEKLGKISSWASLIEPSIQLAEKGFRLTRSEANRLNENKDVFKKLNPDGMPFISKKEWEEGDVLIQKDLAETLRLIAARGRDGFYSGVNAEQLEKFSKAHHGLITKTDLKEYKAIWRKPLTTNWGDYEIHSMGLPSSGGIVLSQILKMLDQKLLVRAGYHDAANIHFIVEAERRAYADRALYLGDSDYYPVPVDSILSSQYITHRFSDFDPAYASSSGNIDSALYNFKKEHFETTHISIADKDGNAASVTTTLNDNYGSKLWVTGAGYFLNNEMDDFSSKPGVPNLYGLIGAEANAIAPGKRMLSSMTPTIVEKNGKLWMVLGTPGGSTIITTVLQVFLNATAFHMNLDDAVQSPRYHHQWFPDEIMYEKNTFSTPLMDSLESMGYNLSPVEVLGLIEAIMIDDKGLLHGAADHRGDDHAAGW
jgi:gamma-glutamyltranspeptidase/glutathione hydrolase